MLEQTMDFVDNDSEEDEFDLLRDMSGQKGYESYDNEDEEPKELVF